MVRPWDEYGWLIGWANDRYLGPEERRIAAMLYERLRPAIHRLEHGPVRFMITLKAVLDGRSPTT